jgi:hypothetical protein
MEIEMPDINSIVVVYDTQQATEAGVRELQKAGFDMTKLSIVGKEYYSEDHIVGYYNTGDRMKYWGQMGAFWGGVCGMLSGAAFFVLPGMGPILIAGPLAAGVAASLDGALASGLTVLGACLQSLGIPQDHILRYEWSLRKDKVLLVAHGVAQELMKAKDLLRATHPGEVNVHFAERTLVAA